MSMLVDFFDFGYNLLPPAVRGERLVAYLKGLTRPLSHLNFEMIGKVANTKYSASFNGQVIMLEHLINDFYDPDERRCYIDDPVNVDELLPYVYNKSENAEGVVVYNKSESEQGGYVLNKSELSDVDFVVFMNSDIYTNTQEPALRALINKYRIAGKRFTIQIFS